MPSSPEEKLKILIVGGGLAGLAAAGWLRKEHEVIVLERGKLADSSTNDYGMSIVANAMQLLLKEGIDPEALESVLFTHTWMHRSDNSLIREQLFETQARFGTASIFTRRARLHAELLRFATQPGVGEPTTIIEGAKVVRIDPEAGLVALEDERTSTLAKNTGIATIMSTVPLESIKSDTALSHLVKDGVAGLSMWYGPRNLRCSFFPIDTKGNFQLVGSIPEGDWTAQFDADRSSIIKDVEPSYALSLFADFHPSLVKLFGSSTTGKHDVWRIRDIDPLEAWSFGSAVLIGDAAHAVTPHIGQGCNIAIEDAEALGFLLRDLKKGDKAGISQAFSLFESLRKSRATYIQLTSRMAGGMLTGEEAERIGPFDPAAFSKAVYSYTGAENALAALKADGPPTFGTSAVP
ncbi:hypothetical protein RQP46_007048 [Phenoliferia psychrophenolica]